MDKDIVFEALKHGTLIKEEDVECIPERVPDSMADENVDVFMVRKYFRQDAWLVVEGVPKQKLKKMSWVCNVCYHDLHAHPSVICESYLLWFLLVVTVNYIAASLHHSHYIM